MTWMTSSAPTGLGWGETFWTTPWRHVQQLGQCGTLRDCPDLTHNPELAGANAIPPPLKPLYWSVLCSSDGSTC